jgi:creatinine amidohydrolase
MEFTNLNWMQIEAYLAEDDRLMLVIGSCEQHGYLSVQTDSLIPHRLAQAASEQSGVLLAPPINFGCSPYFLGYPGTLSLQQSTLSAILKDIFQSAYRQGFRRFLVVNGHGGNTGNKLAVDEIANQLPGFQADWYNWWHSPKVHQIAANYNLQPRHANWLEAFSFTRVTDLPEGEKEFPGRIPSIDADTARQKFGDGSLGGHYLAPDDVMDEIFAACTQEILSLLNFNFS